MRCCWYCWRCHCCVRRCSLESRTHAGGTRRLSCQRQPSILDAPPRHRSTPPSGFRRPALRPACVAETECRRRCALPWRAREEDRRATLGGGITTSLEDTNEEAPKRPALAGKLLGSPQQQVSSASRPSSEQRPGHGRRRGREGAWLLTPSRQRPPPLLRAGRTICHTSMGRRETGI